MNRIHHDRRGVRRVIVSDDQARNLAELDAQHDELDRFLASHDLTGCATPEPREMDELDAAAEAAGEESQDPGDWEPA
ncbi:hypothetical protein [Brachybacterium phenoliresistens]|uniref:hypothetical protein n=1 Tax=Brachybacterium phenoliresistens TaxID=396014 RepID=UPI0031E2340B